MPRVFRRRKLTITARTMGSVADSFTPQLESEGWEVVVRLPEGQRFSAAELAQASRGSEAMIIGDDDASKVFFDAVQSDLKLLVKWGVGTDSIDFQAAERSGVQVRNTPGAFNDEVADLALAYVLGLARHVITVHSSVVQGAWAQLPGTTLSGKTLGIVGFGGIGRSIAIRSLAFGMKVVFFDPYVTQSAPQGCEAKSLGDVLATSDFLVLACPSTPETRGIVNTSSISSMKKGISIINVARGDLIVERDLVGALRAGRLSGVALDVYETEPLPASSELRHFPNVIFGTHNGSNTIEGLLRASSIATEIIIAYGKELRDE